MPKTQTQDGRRALLLLPLAAGGLYLLSHDRTPRVRVEIKEVLLDEAKLLISAGALVLDVRERAAYEARHIPGALLAPLGELPSLLAGSLAYAKAKSIIVYCGNGSTLGPDGTRVLVATGFAGAVNLRPGIQGWAEAGLPVEKGRGRQA